MSAIQMSRVWAMPNADTFDVPEIGAFVRKYLHGSKISVDPFARNRNWVTYTNDIDPSTEADHHMDARAFLELLANKGIRADLVLCDPPYSQEQVKRSYASAGREYEPLGESNNSLLYRQVRDRIRDLLTDDGIVLTFGWNSCGMGPKFEILEIMLVAHGGAHNDTICMAERRVQPSLFELRTQIASREAE